ncbi:alpha/beta fold hydrolase [Nonomuraea thailandensis]
MGDNRAAYRALAAELVAAGFRVATTDLRGHGESSTGWPSYTRTDVAGDLLALIRHLGGPAVIVGHSFSGGAATIAAAQEPGLVSAIVEIGPFTRAQQVNLGALFSDARYRKGMTLLMGAGLFRSVGAWKRYLDHAYPGARPAGHAGHVAALEADLRRPGRMAVVSRMGTSAPTDAGARLGDVRCPALIIMGTLDPDWADPAAEGEGIVAACRPGPRGCTWSRAPVTTRTRSSPPRSPRPSWASSGPAGVARAALSAGAIVDLALRVVDEGGPRR